MATPTSTRKALRKRSGSTVRHTRAIQCDRGKHLNCMPPAPQITERLTALVHPLTLGQVAHFHALGLRERVLKLPVMVALVLTMIWRQEGSPTELVRLLRQEGFFWCSPVRVSVQALSERLRTFPAELFRRVLDDLLPQMQRRWAERERPQPLAWSLARRHYTQILAVDGSTLDALLRKVGTLRGAEKPPLAGRMTALLDLGSRLPQRVWYTEDPQAHDQRFWPDIQAVLERGTLLLYDLGYTNFTVFRELTEAGVTWLTRAKSNLGYTVQQVLTATPQVRDQRVQIGSGADRQVVRLIEVQVGTTWRRYLTSELDPHRLPPTTVVALRRSLCPGETVVGARVLLDGKYQRRGTATVGDVAALCRIDRPDRCGGGPPAAALCRRLRGDGLSQSLLLHGGTSTRHSLGSGHLSGRERRLVRRAQTSAETKISGESP